MYGFSVSLWIQQLGKGFESWSGYFFFVVKKWHWFLTREKKKVQALNWCILMRFTVASACVKKIVVKYIKTYQDWKISQTCTAVRAIQIKRILCSATEWLSDRTINAVIADTQCAGAFLT